MKNFLLSVSLILFYNLSFSQNVGIGTPNPLEKLHVSGNLRTDTLKTTGIKLTPNAGAGKLLTSDASGNATWQSAVYNSNNGTGNIGYGVWGDCQTNAIIAEYQPVEDIPFDASAYFGKSVSISGSYAVVGAPFSDVGVNNEQGSATVYKYDGTEWIFWQKLSDINGSPTDHFGYSVSISGQYIIVGAPEDDNGANADQGSVTIFKLTNSLWAVMQQITDATGAGGDRFGNSVNISRTTVIIGAESDDVGVNTDQGSASVYYLPGANWILANKLTASSGQPNDYFGHSVAVSGIYCVIGSYFDDIGGNTNQGSAKVFRNIANNWTFLVSLTDINSLANDNFGSSVAIDSTTIIIGAPYHKVALNTSQGSAYLFYYDGSAWVLTKTLVQSDGEAFDYFGRSVAISGNYALVGADEDNINTFNNAGSATLYLKIGNSWGKLQYITDPRSETSTYFGASVALDSATKRFLTGGGASFFGLGFSNKAFFGRIY